MDRTVSFHKSEPTEKELYAQARKMAKEELKENVDRLEMMYWDDFSEAWVDIAVDYSATATFGVRAQIVPEGMDPLDCAPEDFEQKHFTVTVSMERDDHDGKWKGTVDLQEK